MIKIIGPPPHSPRNNEFVSLFEVPLLIGLAIRRVVLLHITQAYMNLGVFCLALIDLAHMNPGVFRLAPIAL